MDSRTDIAIDAFRIVSSGNFTPTKNDKHILETIGSSLSCFINCVDGYFALCSLCRKPNQDRKTAGLRSSRQPSVKGRNPLVWSHRDCLKAYCFHRPITDR